MRLPHWNRTWRTVLPTAGVAALLALGAVPATTAHAASPDVPAKPEAPAGAGAKQGAKPAAVPEAARELGAGQKLSSFTVKFPAAPYRTANVRRAVQLIDGSAVQPGGTWSFNGTVGERTPENGFVDGIMINDGRYVKSPGGGVSAVATTMYNAVFFAGLKPVEHGAHSFYIERYPEGREATVAWGTLDLRWQNDSGHPVYVQAAATDHSVTITLYGTRQYDAVRAVKHDRTKVTEPVKRELSGPDCEVQTPYEGFDVAVDRIFERDGREVARETFRTHYTPRDEIVCVPASPSASAPSAGATPGTDGGTATPRPQATPGAAGAAPAPTASAAQATPTGPSNPATPAR